MSDWLRARFALRPWWMNLMMLFCAYMAFIYVPWDFLVKDVALDEEVWFGVRFHGRAAKALEIPHGIVYALGAIGFWRMHRLMHPWASLYLAQVAFSFAVFPWLYHADLPLAARLASSLIFGALFGALTWLIWRSKPLFGAPPPPAGSD